MPTTEKGAAISFGLVSAQETKGQLSPISGFVPRITPSSSLELMGKSRFQLKRAQALVVVSARHRELFDAKVRLDCVTERR